MRVITSVIRLFAVAGLLAMPMVAPAMAATAAKPSTTKSDTKTQSLDAAQAVAQSYNTAKPLQQGLIVQVDEKNKGSVAAATYKDSKKMFGVAVAANQTAVSLSTTGDQQKAYVVTSGRYNVLVSSQNGVIAAGDFVSISAADGIGMKADTTENEVLGRAVTSFDGKKDVLSTTELKQSDGKTLKAAIGTVMVDISIQPNPLKANSESGVPSVVQRIAISLVGKPISAPQLYASSAILVVGLLVVSSLLYGGIQTGMTAIGRNPLARKSIMRNLVQVIATGIMIFLGCLIAVYLILKI